MHKFVLKVSDKTNSGICPHKELNLKVFDFPVECEINKPWKFCIDNSVLYQTSKVQKITCDINGEFIDCTSLENVKELINLISNIRVETLNSIYSLTTVGEYENEEEKEDF